MEIKEEQVIKEDRGTTEIKEEGIIKVGIIKVGIIKEDIIKVGIIKEDIIKVGIIKEDIIKVGIIKVGLIKVGIIREDETKVVETNQEDKVVILLQVRRHRPRPKLLLQSQKGIRKLSSIRLKSLHPDKLLL